MKQVELPNYSFACYSLE